MKEKKNKSKKGKKKKRREKRTIVNKTESKYGKRKYGKYVKKIAEDYNSTNQKVTSNNWFNFVKLFGDMFQNKIKMLVL